MGFLSKLFGRSDSPDDGGDDVEMSGEEFAELEPRDQHYLFAHRILPAIARRSPGQILEDLSDPEDADEVLRLIWDIPAEDLAGRDIVESEGLRAVVRRFEAYRIGIVKLPPALKMTEAYFVALVFGSAPNEEGAIEPALSRYIALERTFDSDEGEVSTVLGEWAEDSHLNYGAGPAPELDLFFERVCEMLRSNPDLHARTTLGDD